MRGPRRVRSRPQTEGEVCPLLSPSGVCSPSYGACADKLPRVQTCVGGKEEGSQSSRCWEGPSWTKQRRKEDQRREE